MTHAPAGQRHSLRWAAVAATLAAALAVLALAGAAGAATTSPRGGQRFAPGAFGSVAAISGTSMEVQSAEAGQTTVDWVSSTIFTQTVTVSATSVVTGDCATVTGKQSKKGVITATTVAISAAPSSGACAGGTFRMGRPGSVPGAGSKLHPPSGRTSGGTFAHRGAPFGDRPGAKRSFPGASDVAFASGKVTAVATKTLTISGFSSAGLRTPSDRSKSKSSTDPSSKTKSSKSSKSPKIPKIPKAKTTTVHVEVGPSTTYTETETAAPLDLAVGDCVTATGASAANGSVSASAVRITSTGRSSTSCTTGPGAFAGPGGRRAGGAVESA